MYIILVLISLVQLTFASLGNVSPFFQKCTESCSIFNCTEDVVRFLEPEKQSFHLKLLQWDCLDECKYECMWKTVEVFERRKWRVPQFYGKWPFLRLFGIQEPASTLFSLLNMYCHFMYYKKFKRSVRRDVPLYWLWNIFTAVNINAWIWSAIFHARDFPFTEFMDYTCALSIIMINVYCMFQRVFLGMPKLLNILFTSVFVSFFVNHAIYLSYNFDYEYNMQVNIGLGAIGVISWTLWSLYIRKLQPYVWKCLLYVWLQAMVLILEVYDYPPILWIFDAHSLWHLSTAIITPLFYNFVIDDCKYLRKKAQKA